MLHPIEKDILEVMIENGCEHGRWLTTNKIRELMEEHGVNLNWQTINRHLIILLRNHYVRRKAGTVRTYLRDKVNVESASNILWTLNIK